MSESKVVLDYLQQELASDQPTTTLMNALKVLQPGVDRLVFDAKESATRVERTECVCRLLASGLSTDEVYVLLCLRREEVEDIAKAYGNNEKIAKYAKTLKERRKRHGLL